jgi:hypothetical protein
MWLAARYITATRTGKDGVSGSIGKHPRCNVRVFLKHNTVV